MERMHADAMVEGRGRGRGAEHPGQIPLRGWWDVVRRTKQEAKVDDVVLLSAGVAFYALLSLVPALIALVSLYGLVADPQDVDRQVGDALSAAPAEVRDLVSEQLQSVTGSAGGGLSLAVVGGLVLALWSASSGMKHLMSAINIAYDEEETRGFVALRLRALALTLAAIVYGCLAMAVVSGVPALAERTSMGFAAETAAGILRWPLLGLGAVAALSALYRFGPDRDDARWSWTAPGTILATVVWVLASLAFSFYTRSFGSYGETYGSLGAVVVLMLWLLLSAVAVIVGAEVNAEAEHQTARDSTTGRERPPGRRGAYVADHVAP